MLSSMTHPIGRWEGRHPWRAQAGEPRRVIPKRRTVLDQVAAPEKVAFGLGSGRPDVLKGFSSETLAPETFPAAGRKSDYQVVDLVDRCCKRLTKQVLETALELETAEHVAMSKHKKRPTVKEPRPQG